MSERERGERDRKQGETDTKGEIELKSDKFRERLMSEREREERRERQETGRDRYKWRDRVKEREIYRETNGERC